MSLPWTLNTAQEALIKNGFTIVDPAANGNMHVLGHRCNPDVTSTVCCTRLGQNPTSVVVTPSQSAACNASEQIRDYIKKVVSLEGDVVLNPVNH